MNVRECAVAVSLAGLLIASTAALAKPKKSKPFLSFAGDHAELHLGDRVRLTWASLSTKFCQASGDWSGKMRPDGGWSSPPLTGSKTYQLQCMGGGGASVIKTVHVAVAPADGDEEPMPAPTAGSRYERKWESPR